nr:hypothetical protein Iba_chr11cCG7720 [Ipomoea batatas]
MTDARLATRGNFLTTPWGEKEYTKPSNDPTEIQPGSSVGKGTPLLWKTKMAEVLKGADQSSQLQQNLRNKPSSWRCVSVVGKSFFVICVYQGYYVVEEIILATSKRILHIETANVETTILVNVHSWDSGSSVGTTTAPL